MADDSPSDMPVDPQFEVRYRRAYINGATEVLYLLAHKLSDQELAVVTEWVDQSLVPWSREGLDTAKRPPDFPMMVGQRPRRHGGWF